MLEDVGPHRDRERVVAVLVGIAMLVSVLVLPPVLIRTPQTATPTAVGPAPPPVSCDRRITPASEAIPEEGTWARLRVPTDVACATWKPKVTVAGRVSPTSSFTIRTRERLSAKTLAKRLTLNPATAYSVSVDPDEPARTFEITPTEPLREGAVYRAQLADPSGDRQVQSWAFRTDAPLRVVATLPRDEGTEVPRNSGIEITFSHEGVEGVQRRFSISPKVAGRFETHGETLVFVPKGLAPGTLYTVRLAPGVALPGTDHRIARETVFRFETTRETADEGSMLFFLQKAWESRPGEVPVVAVAQYSANRTRALPIEVYRYASAQAMATAWTNHEGVPVWSHYAGGARQIPLGGLTKVASFDGNLEPVGPDQSESTIRFPAALLPGFYLIRATLGKRIATAFLQSTDLAGYSVVSGRSSLVWVNDLASKGAVTGARLRLGGRSLATTNADGVAFFETPAALKAPDRAAMIVTSGARSLVLPPASAGYGTPRPYAGGRSYDSIYPTQIDALGYWRYVTTDRHLYRPSDTVRIWGLLRPREGALRKRPLELVVTSGEDGAEIARAAVTAGPSGTFIAEIPFEGLTPGGYSITVTSVGDQLHSTWFEVQDYVKPAYGLTVTPNPRAVIKGARAVYEVEAEFFEGTPLPDLKLTHSGSSTAGTETTDDAGKARISLPTGSVHIYGTEGSHELSVRPARAEEGDISAGASTRVFPSALTLEGDAVLVGTTARVTGVVHHLDLSRINSGTEQDYGDHRGDPARGVRVSATVTRTRYRQIDEGEYYDYISKRTEKRYRYEEERKAIGTFTDTTNARGGYDMRFPADDDSSYEVALSTTDAEQRTTKLDTYVHGGHPGSFDQPLMKVDPEKRYKVGERATVVAELADGTSPSGGSNRYLFHLTHLGLRRFAIQDTPTYAFTFEDAFVPNVEVDGALFDGERLHDLPSTYLTFDQDTRALTVDVTPRGSRFAPGTTARLDVQVRDATGRGRRAEVLLSAVDEAFYRLQGPGYFAERDVLMSLYSRVNSDVADSYKSHGGPVGRGQASFDESGMATPEPAVLASADAVGAGSAGSAPTRSDFRDVGLFTAVTTDANGRAVATFNLPDNLTSWRVNAIAVTDDLFAGSTTSAVAVGLPVFVDVGLNTSYLTDDRPGVRVRAFGDGIPSGAPARFTLRAPTLADAPITVTGTAFQPMDIPLPPLKDGRHAISVEVAVGGESDRVEREIVVAPSRILTARSRFSEITTEGGAPPEGSAERPTRLVLSDHNRGRYHAATQNLAWSWGDRLDQMLARAEAQRLLATQFGEPDVPFPAEFRAAAYQTPKGGISILTYSDDDLGVSARVAALDADRFDRGRLRRYFRAIVEDENETRRRALTALWGLAALGDDVLADVRAASIANLTPIERLMVGMAASALGDDDAARTAYRKVLAEVGEERGQIVRVNAGSDDATIEATALAAWLGARIGDALSARLFRYTQEDSATELLVVLEQVGYLSAALPALSGERVRFRYTVDGRTTDTTLEQGESLALRLTPAQRKTLKVEVIEGQLGAVTAFEEPTDLARSPRDAALTVTRTMTGERNGVVRLSDSDLVKITISVRFSARALSGCTQVSDLLPSGLRPVTTWGARLAAEDAIGRSPDTWQPYDIVGQRVSFCAYPDQKRQAEISYFARVIGTGTFIAEPVVAASQRDPSRVAVSAPLEVRIS